MAAPGIDDIQEGIAANLSAIPGVQVSAYMLGNPSPPAIEVQLGWRYDGRASINYDQTFRRGIDTLNFTVRAMVGVQSDIGAQKRLLRLIAPTGSESVKAVLEVNSTLSGVIQKLQVTECRGPMTFGREGAPPLYGAEWRVEVWAVGA